MTFLLINVIHILIKFEKLFIFLTIWKAQEMQEAPLYDELNYFLVYWIYII